MQKSKHKLTVNHYSSSVKLFYCANTEDAPNHVRETNQQCTGFRSNAFTVSKNLTRVQVDDIYTSKLMEEDITNIDPSGFAVLWVE
jgi:hypothetical protein